MYVQYVWRTEVRRTRMREGEREEEGRGGGGREGREEVGVC